jgi:cytochrome P450
VSPVKEFMRTATSDATVGHTKVAKGDSLYLAYLSANRDEEVFDDPFRFDVGRDPNPHLAFGIGPHFCLGAQLARMEVRVLFTELVGRVEHLELAGPPASSSTIFVGGLKRLPIAYRMAA